MVLVSVLSNCLKSISNAEKRGKRQVLVRPSSKVVIKFLSVMMANGKCGFTQNKAFWGFGLGGPTLGLVDAGTAAGPTLAHRAHSACCLSSSRGAAAVI